MMPKLAKKIGIGCVVLLGLGAIGGYLTSGVWGPVLNASNDLEAALTRAKAVGLPISAAELNPDPPVPESEDGAPALMRLDAALEADRDYQADFDSPKGQALVKRMVPLVIELSKYTRMDRHLDWDLGPVLPMKGVSALRFAAKVHQYQAIQAARSGDDALAIEHLKAAEGLAALLFDSPMAVDSLTAKILHGINCTTAGRVAEVWANDPVRLKLLQESLTQPKFTPLSRTLDFEFYAGLVISRNHVSLKDLENSSISKPILNPKSVKRSGLPTDPLHRANLAVFADTIANLKRTCSQEDDPKVINAEFDRLRKIIPDSPVHQLTGLMFPNSGSITSYAQAEVFTQMRDAVVKLYQYRARTKSFPKTLAEAGLTINDPFSSASVVYRASKDEFVIYSIGAIRKDRGGPEKMGNFGFRFPSKR